MAGSDIIQTVRYERYEIHEQQPTNLGVAQLVARYLGVVEAGCSSHLTQTNKSNLRKKVAFLFYKKMLCFLDIQAELRLKRDIRRIMLQRGKK